MTAPQPPHARTWRAIRERCDKHEAGNCAYPFCRCQISSIAERWGIKTTREQWERSSSGEGAGDHGCKTRRDRAA